MDSPAKDGASAEHLPARIVGRYALHDAIASGGMATVFIGRHLGPVGFSRTVAIKQLHPQFSADAEFVSMFLDEARLVGRIRHPNVVQTLDVVATDGELFLVMDYVHGVSLARLLRAKQLMPLPVVVAIVSGALQGLHAAHEAKSEHGVPLAIVHRDVSPQNVLVGKDGGTRVLDFGIAKAAVRLQSTRDGELKGKLEYMAPEQLMNEPISRQLDVYAASVMLWEMTAGRGLFRAESKAGLLKMILLGELPEATTGRAAKADEATLAALSKLESVIQCGLSRRPEDRFETAHAMAMALESIVTPASSAQVATWVARLAGPDLARQQDLVAEIEGSQPRISLRPDVAEDLARSVRAKVAAEDGTRPLRRPGPASDVATAPIAREVTVAARGSQRAIVTEVRVLPVTSARRWLGGATALFVLGLVAIFSTRSLRPGSTGPVTSASAPSASAAAATSSLPPPAPAPTQAEASALPPPVPAPLATPSVLNHPTRAKATRAPQDAPRAGNGGTTVRSSSDCSPPFTYDANGVKHYKPECPL